VRTAFLGVFMLLQPLRGNAAPVRKLLRLWKPPRQYILPSYPSGGPESRGVPNIFGASRFGRGIAAGKRLLWPKPKARTAKKPPERRLQPGLAAPQSGEVRVEVASSASGEVASAKAVS
jgi:hypothetical protein